MEIKMNQSTFERFLRIIVGGVFLMVATYVPLSTYIVWFLLILGIVLILTGLSGYCPINTLCKRTGK